MSVRRGNFKLAYRSLQAAKARSFLTMLGIIVGVMAVVLMVCIGQGIKQQISGQIGQYGKDIFTVSPGSAAGGSNLLGAGLSTGSSALLTSDDLQAVEATHGVRYAVPLATATGSMQGDHTVNNPFIVATTADFPNVLSQPIAYGGFFDDTVDSHTVVLGTAIAQRLFNDNAPLGQSLSWRGQQFIVAGVFSDFNAPPFSLAANFNNAVFVPYSTAQNLMHSVLGLYQIVGRAASPTQLPAVSTAVHRALVRAHGGADDVTVMSASASGGASDQALHLVTALVVGAAIIALVVGGVGVMDVLLVSVTERMHEIGLRKAIGATNRQIMRQFMAEAVVLSAAGAVLGLLGALAVIGLLHGFTDVHPALVWQVFVLAPVIAVAVGMLFGTAPALKAARKDPIDALRHE